MKVTRKEWYRRVNDTWPEKVPDLTGEEAERAAKRLYRFVLKRTFKGTVRIASGNRRNKAWSNHFVLNPGTGWKGLIHDLSHWWHWGNHSGAHARLERRMIKEVLSRGWLDGKLKSAPRPEKAKPSLQHRRYQAALRNLERWQKRKKRADNAIKRLRVRVRYYQRRLGPVALTDTGAGIEVTK